MFYLVVSILLAIVSIPFAADAIKQVKQRVRLSTNDLIIILGSFTIIIVMILLVAAFSTARP